MPSERPGEPAPDKTSSKRPIENSKAKPPIRKLPPTARQLAANPALGDAAETTAGRQGAGRQAARKQAARKQAARKQAAGQQAALRQTGPKRGGPKKATATSPNGRRAATPTDPPAERRAIGDRLRTVRKWAIRTAAVVAVLAVLWALFLVFVRIATTYMWFDSVDHGAVYRTEVEAQILLFCIFAIIGGLIGGLTMFGLLRMRAPLPFSPKEDPFRSTFRRFEPRLRKLFVLLAVVIPGVLLGSAAGGRWQTYLLWRNAVPWHRTDPQFHKDISFFIEIYPFHVMVVSLLLQAVTYGLFIAVIGGYLYGGWRPRNSPKKITRDFTRLMSFLIIGYLVLKAAWYWVTQYSAVTSQQGPVTGAGYTVVHAVLPGMYVMMAIALLGALVLVANLLRRARVRVIGATVVVVALAWTLVGTAWPGLLYHFREAPSQASLDLAEIAHNQKATLAAYGLDHDVTTVSDQASTSTHGNALVKLADSSSQISLIDPNQLAPTFNVEQQLQAYYGFKSTLDIGHYTVGGKSQDVALAARELQSSGIPKPSWVNSHLVYTHGYGVVAAPTTTVDPKTESPDYYDGGMPPGNQIPITRPQIYFGQAFSGSSYSIVGQPAGSKQQIEFDHPGGNGSSNSAHSTYRGDGGIPIGSTLRKFLFAVQLHDPNIFFSSDINSASQLLTLRNPRSRVAKVAPWLTLDGDIYPAIVDGQIKWIVDGYTTSSNYPDSQTVNLHSASQTTLTANGASVAQGNQQINYMQNSVKAVVDAYTGKVNLYEWNQAQHPDPLLKAWEAVFPGLVQPQSDIPSALMSQLRYPSDLFNVQRTLLAKYHVGQPANFYSGNDFWAVPSDPTVAAAKSINSHSSAGGSAAPLPSRYMSMSLGGSGAVDQHYSLSSPMVTLNGRQLAAFVYVNSEPGPDYGKFTVLKFPPGAATGESPLQVQNDIESDTRITEALTLQRGGNSRVVLGGLEAIPVAGRMLYVEPVYTQSNGGASFPILRHVIALYGNGDPSFQTDLGPALREAVRSAPGTG